MNATERLAELLTKWTNEENGIAFAYFTTAELESTKKTGFACILELSNLKHVPFVSETIQGAIFAAHRWAMVTYEKHLKDVPP